ncbi:MAG: glycosyltransferase family 2 protein [Gaiellales bacterium]
MREAQLSVVIPHWPIDAEIDEALRDCLVTLPVECEKLVIVNDGTGFAHNVNVGFALANGDFIAVVTNDTRVVDGDVYDLCVAGTVTSPIVLEKPGIEPGGFHGAFWVAPREVIERVGPLDERFEGAFFEDDDYLERLKAAGVPRRQISTVRVVSRRVGLTMSKIRDQADKWYAANEKRFEEKWGWLPPPSDPDLAASWKASR